MKKLKVKCAYCGRMIESEMAERGISSGKPYCPEAEIKECINAFGDRVEMIDYTYRPATR